MAAHFVITEYIQRAMVQAEYDKLEDGTFSGRIPACKGVIAFGSTLHECEEELRSTLEDWLLVGFKLGHVLPVIDGIDLNKEPADEPVDTL
jgi:predicted RNase H-like HicB family nuclease